MRRRPVLLLLFCFAMPFVLGYWMYARKRAAKSLKPAGVPLAAFLLIDAALLLFYFGEVVPND